MQQQKQGIVGMFKDVKLFKHSLPTAVLLSVFLLTWAACNRGVADEKNNPVGKTTLEALSNEDSINSPAEAINVLKKGYDRYKKGQFRHIHIKRVQPEEKINNRPSIAVLSCSEMKLPPEILFDTEKESLLLLHPDSGTVSTLMLPKLDTLLAGVKLLVLLVQDGGKMSATRTTARSALQDSATAMMNKILLANQQLASNIKSGTFKIITALYRDSDRRLVFSE